MKIVFYIIISISLSLASDIVIDKKTGLMWQDNHAVKYVKKEWQGAMKVCQQLHLAGYNDWRLPNIHELLNLIDKSKHDPVIKKEFKNISASGYYWSSSEHENKEFAWMMNFTRGYEYNNYKSYERYVRCARDIK